MRKLSNIPKNYSIFGVFVIDEKPDDISINVLAQLRLYNIGFFILHINWTKKSICGPIGKSTFR